MSTPNYLVGRSTALIPASVIILSFLMTSLLMPPFATANDLATTNDLATGDSPAQAQNLLVDGGFENLSQNTWHPYGKGFQISTDNPIQGKHAVKMTVDGFSTGGIRQTLRFDPPIFTPLRISGWSKVDPQSQLVSDPTHGGDYNIYIDAFYDDGSPLWARVTPFDSRAKQWKQAQSIIYPAKPIKEIQVFVFLRRINGTVWFDDIKIEKIPFGLESFDLQAGQAGPGSVFAKGRFNWRKEFLPKNFNVELFQLNNGVNSDDKRIPIPLSSNIQTTNNQTPNNQTTNNQTTNNQTTNNQTTNNQTPNNQTTNNQTTNNQTPNTTVDDFGLSPAATGDKSWFYTIQTNLPDAVQQSGDTRFAIVCTADGKPFYQTTRTIPVTIRKPQNGQNITASDALVWTESSMKRVFLTTLPPLPLPDHPQVNLEQARNERESFQIAVLSPKTISQLRVELSDLVSDTTTADTTTADTTTADTTTADTTTTTNTTVAKIDRSQLDWKQVGYVLADKIQPHLASPDAVPGFWPDLLLPRTTGFVPANQTISFWITVAAPKDARPGSYSGTVRLFDDSTGQPQLISEVAVKTRVWDITLEPDMQLPTGFALMDGFLEYVYKETPTPEVRRRFAEFLIDHRLSPEGDITRTELPDLDSLSAYKDRGLGKFNVLNFAPPRGSRPWIPFAGPEYYTEQQKEQFRQQLIPYVEQLRKRGLTDHAYFYSFDERGEDYHPIMTSWFGMVKESFPEIQTFTSAYLDQDPELLNKLNVDWICPVSARYDYDRAKACRAAGKQVWSYVCCGPGYPYANIMFRFPLIEARVLGWQAFQQQYDGFLYWGVNIWNYGRNRPGAENIPIDPNGPIKLNWATDWTCGGIQIYGDGCLIYPAVGQTPIGSIRLANLRDGLDDYILLNMLRKKIGNVDELQKITQPVSASPIDFTRDPDTLLRQRAGIAGKLVEPVDNN